MLTQKFFKSDWNKSCAFWTIHKEKGISTRRMNYSRKFFFFFFQYENKHENKVFSLQQALEIMPNYHSQSKIDNGNNYNTKFALSQNIDKNKYKSSLF